MAKLTTFIKFVKERESIRLKKEAGEPAPWTKDNILQKYRFCNIRRADDRVSRWLIRHVLSNNVPHHFDPAKFLEVTAWCRWVNWPPTIQKVMEAGLFDDPLVNWTKVGKFVDRLPGKKWTGAYMIAAPRMAKEKKGLFVAKQVIQGSLRPLVPTLITRFSNGNATCEEIWKLLQEQNYFGSFMSGQIVGDWAYTPLLHSAQDRLSWAPIGPGSKRGFNRLLRRPLKTKISLPEWEAKLESWGATIRHELGYAYADITALDVQNQLCELDKYLRVKNGEGRPRANYRPEVAYNV